jgi:hypothetical protein
MQVIYNDTSKYPGLPKDHTLNDPLYIPEDHYGGYWLNGDSADQLIYAERDENNLAIGVSFPPNNLPDVGTEIASPDGWRMVYQVDHEVKKVILCPL